MLRQCLNLKIDKTCNPHVIHATKVQAKTKTKREQEGNEDNTTLKRTSLSKTRVGDDAPTAGPIARRQTVGSLCDLPRGEKEDV